VPVLRANLAYKAVPIVAGENDIEFRFDAPAFDALALLLSANAACWLAAIAWLASTCGSAPRQAASTIRRSSDIASV